MRPDFPDMTEPTYILFDGKARAGRSKLHRVPVEDFFNSLLAGGKCLRDFKSWSSSRTTL